MLLNLGVTERQYRPPLCISFRTPEVRGAACGSGGGAFYREPRPVNAL